MSTMADAKSRRPRRRFTDEFKQQAVRLVLDEGKSVTAVARELDLVASALGAWVKHALRIAEEERDILKKATAFFAKQSR